MNKNIIKLICILLGMVFLFRLWYVQMEKGMKHEKPEGESITIEDVNILLNALNIDMKLEPELAAGFLTYGQYKEIYEYIDGSAKGIADFADKYEEDYNFLKEDWYQAFQIMLAYYDTESSIWKTTLFILKTDAQENKLYTPENEYTYFSSSFTNSEFNKEEVYVKNDELLTSIRVLDERTILENVWVMETMEDNGVYKLECFYHQLEFIVPASAAAQREQVADLTFENGRLKKVKSKSDKIHGKLLSVSDDYMEIEGYGNYKTEDKMEVYKLYGTLQTQKKNDLMIGYDYTDFVIQDNKICACLISREGEIDKIRVLLKNTKDGGYFYDEALVTVDGNETRIKADEMKAGERQIFQSSALTDRVKIEIDGINKSDNYYRGALEFYKNEQGMVIINELPLEEYLYAVVPSEMPAYYPIEALKAQAVCARTYAYRHILHAGLADFGAHLDDTTSYQVYHNIDEHSTTTTAVKETAGMMLYYQDELAENYYYSTSCGYGTDTTIWKSEAAAHIPYIRGLKIADEGAAESAPDADELKDEEKFEAFIKSVDESDFESNEAWYRWKYEVVDLDADGLTERVKERYQANPSLILTRKENENEYYYVSESIGEIGKLKDINITKRGSGGIADEMIITGSKAVIKVISEYNIRRILCDGKADVIRQDGSSVAAGTLLPSAFLVMDAGISDSDMVGYTITGGGYGHGVGMSQNAAKEIGGLGYDYKGILKLFFADCEVHE